MNILLISLCIPYLGPPRIRKSDNETVTAVSGSDLTLPCVAEGSPKPVVTWKINDKDISYHKEKFTQLESGSLQIKHLLPSDTGLYRCIATNPFGDDFWEIVLFIQGRKCGFSGSLILFITLFCNLCCSLFFITPIFTIMFHKFLPDVLFSASTPLRY